MISTVERLLLRRTTALTACARVSHPRAPLRAPAWSRCTPRAPATRRHFASGEAGPNPAPGKSTLKVWPFILIFLAGTGGYVMLVKQRTGDTTANAMSQFGAPGTRFVDEVPKSSPTFAASHVTVIFVLGGPGAGKGTQCANLVKDYGFTHLSAGDLLRAEQDRPGSQYGQLIKDYIKDGRIVPMEVTVALLEQAMKEQLARNPDPARGKFLIDGFPRKLDQAHKFEAAVCKAKLVLFFDCPEDVMEQRLLKRGETSGRSDDNLESIKKRFRTFVDTSMPVVDEFEKAGKVIKIQAVKTPDLVYADTKTALEEKLGKGF